MAADVAVGGTLARIDAPPADAQAISFPTSISAFDASFTTIQDLGKGRFGEVSLVEHISSGARYALKRTKFGKSGQPDAVKVEVEAEALGRLRHDNVIRHHAAFSYDDPKHGQVLCSPPFEGQPAARG